MVSSRSAPEDDDALKGLADRYLAAKGIRTRLRFPKPLERRYDSDTRKERARTLGWFGGIGTAILLLMYPSLLASLPDMRAQSHWLYLGLCVPASFGCSALMLCNPQPALREGMIAVVNCGIAMSITHLFLASRMADMAVLVGVVFVLVVYSTVGVQLRFGYAVCVVSATLALYSVGLYGLPGLSHVTKRDLSLLGGCGGFYTLVANRRLERQARRFYVLSLRQHLQGQDLVRHNQELDELSKSDALTGLANRRAYDLWLARAWAEAVEESGDVGLLVIDVDRFKAYNDFYGHAAGDICLQTIARCLGEQLRGMSDLVARLGGEEFAVLLPGLGEAAATEVAERLRVAVAGLELPNLGVGRSGLITVSAGVATRLGSKATTPERLFDAADSALYGAKRGGRNAVCVSGEQDEVVEERRRVG